MIDVQKLTPGTEVVHIKTGKITTVLTGSYEEPSIGWMLKTALYPGGFPSTEFALNGEVQQETGIAVKQQPVIVFKGKMIGDLEETIITPALIEEKSKPLLALKINGIFDTEGAEKVKEAITKAVKMRTLVEKQADPLIKSINAQAKKDVQSVKDLAQPIYDACMATQNALQLTYDTWATEVNKAKQAEAELLKAKTDGRDKAMFGLNMLYNGSAFTGYGKTISQDVLHAMADDKYAVLLVEIEGMQMEQGVTGKEVEASISIPIGMTEQQKQEVPNLSAIYAGNGKSYTIAKREFPAAVYERDIPGTELRIVIIKGTIDADGSVLIANDQILQSAYFVNIVK